MRWHGIREENIESTDLEEVNSFEFIESHFVGKRIHVCTFHKF